MIYLLSRNNKSNNFNGVKEEKNSGESIICQNVNLSNNIPNYLLIGWFHYILSSWKKKSTQQSKSLSQKLDIMIPGINGEIK